MTGRALARIGQDLLARHGGSASEGAYHAKLDRMVEGGESCPRSGNRQRPVRCCRELHGALTTRDCNRFCAITSPDVTWTLPGNNKVSGQVNSVEEAIAHAELIAFYAIASPSNTSWSSATTPLWACTTPPPPRLHPLAPGNGLPNRQRPNRGNRNVLSDKPGTNVFFALTGTTKPQANRPAQRSRHPAARMSRQRGEAGLGRDDVHGPRSRPDRGSRHRAR